MTQAIKREATENVFHVDDAHRFRIDQGFIQEFVGREPAWGPVGKVAYVRTYARELRGSELIEHLIRDRALNVKEARERGRKLKMVREEFWQTARRVVEFTWTVFKSAAIKAHHPWDEGEAQEKAQEMFRRLWAFKWLPPGRGMQFAGTPVVERKGGAVLNNCGFRSTRDIDLDFASPFCDVMDFLMLGVGMGSDVRGAGKVTIVEAKEDPNWVYVVEDSREGWVDAMRVQLTGFITGRLPSRFDYSKIRREGEVLKTFGGTASGYGPLQQLLTAVWNILSELEGQPITATAIADIVNHIGKCVVAGNIRRSAEILLGEDGDQEFMQLKDPSRLWELSLLQTTRAGEIPEVAKLQKSIAKPRSAQEGHSAASSVYLMHQDRIDRLEKRRKKLLAADEVWSDLEASIKAHPLWTHRWASNNTLLFSRDADFTGVAKQIATNGEPGVMFLENVRAYGRMNNAGAKLPDPAFWADPLVSGCNPCGEQPLEDGELCCLGELNPNAHDTLDDYLITVKYAYMYCKSVTLVPTNNKNTNKIMTRNRRVGLSMMGIFAMYERLGMQECIRWWDTAYEEVRRWDRTYSDWLGVNRSIKVTSVKPGGTIPLLVGQEGGMKSPTAKYIFRTMRIEHQSPLAKRCEEAGYRVEKDRASPRTVVIYFPVHDETNARTSEQISLWEQMELLAQLQAHWSDNMVSCTINYQPHEAKDIRPAIAAYASRIKGVSFLPLMTHGFPQAPYIPISQREYEVAAARLLPLDLRGVGHEVDEKYCTGEVCEVKR
jgi:adenosylcobalamin-dependent ribonucleoside-triphosphate reductase